MYTNGIQYTFGIETCLKSVCMSLQNASKKQNHQAGEFEHYLAFITHLHER